jgi:hypothetical protein
VILDYKLGHWINVGLQGDGSSQIFPGIMKMTAFRSDQVATQVLKKQQVILKRNVPKVLC